MENQHNILLVANSLSRHDVSLLRRAICKHLNHSKIHLVYVVPNIPANYYQIPSVAHLEDQLYQKGITTLKRLGKKLGIQTADQYMSHGPVSAAAEVLAEKLDAELVIIEDIIESDVYERFSLFIQHLFHRLQRSIAFINPQNSIAILKANSSSSSR